MVAAIFFPFLELSVAGLHRTPRCSTPPCAFASGLDGAALRRHHAAHHRPAGHPRRGARLHAPAAPARPPARPRRRAAFRIAAHLKPWAMAEVFLIGVVVALVKIGGMATIDLGPAFWAMAGLVLLVVLEGASLSEWSIWQTLERPRAAPDRPRRRAGRLPHLRQGLARRRRHLPALRLGAAPAHPQQPAAGARLALVGLHLLPAREPPADAPHPHPRPRPAQHHRRRRGRAPQPRRHPDVAGIIFLASILIPISKFVVILYLALLDPLPGPPRRPRPDPCSTRSSSSSAAGR